MKISYVKIENYRNFQNFEITLPKLSILIGENDSGKSNFINALKLPLSGNEFEFGSRRLYPSDFNTNTIKKFYNDFPSSVEKNTIIPIIKVTIRFDEINDEDNYAKAIVGKWITELEGEDIYEIQYVFKPKNNDEFIEYIELQLKEKTKNEEPVLPTELYEYAVVSTNNRKSISFHELKHISINIINAERDDFSVSNTMKSNSVLAKLLEKELNEQEKSQIHNAYKKFFQEIKNQDNFSKIFKKDESFKNIDDLIDNIDCIPNLANLKNILSNITLGYGNEFLYQKGLGVRNLIFILLFFQHYKNKEENFNLNCIEEPESHLSTNNLNLILDYIMKTNSKLNDSSLSQTIITTHKPEVINKLKFNNVIALSNNKAISFQDIDKDLVSYLAKRPNFDILKLLFSNKIILVEGTTEEMLINTYLDIEKDSLYNIDVLSIGHKGFRKFLDVWLKLNEKNLNKKIGIIRDFDNQPNAKNEHDKYHNANTIYVSTSSLYTLEDDLVNTDKNYEQISKHFELGDSNADEVSKYMKDNKAESMLSLCNAILNKDITIKLSKHISNVIKFLK